MEKNKSGIVARIENGFIFGLLVLLVLLLFLEIVLRGTAVRSFGEYIQHLVVWITFLGAMLTTREKKHLALTAGLEFFKGRGKSLARLLSHFVVVFVITTLFFCALGLVVSGLGREWVGGWLPLPLLAAVLPVGFFCMLVRFLGQGPGGWKARLLAVAGILLGLFLAFSALVRVPMELADKQVMAIDVRLGELESAGTGDEAEAASLEQAALGAKRDRLNAFYDKTDAFFYAFREVQAEVTHIFYWPLFLLLICAAVCGAPLFVVLGGIAVLLYNTNPDSMITNIPTEAFVVLQGQEIAAIPLFALAGFILSESRAGERFIRFFRALIGWLPGGVAVVTVVVCAFFTTFTGATGVTILALGGLLSFALIEGKYGRNFSEGLITGSGSIGLLFPPSLPLILYAVAAQINVKKMFVGGVLPGFLLVACLAVMGVMYAIRHKAEKTPFSLQALGKPLRAASLELLLPVVILVSFFSGFATLIETGALTIIYVLLIEVFVYRDIKLSQLPAVFLKSVPVVGGILIIIAVANGLASYIIDAEIPQRLAEWMKTYIASPLVFLLLLNIGLLITGCFLDIFSAILVVAPLVIALGKVYGIDDVHLGIIFLANLQLGYLTPPVGMNLFVAAYKFESPLGRIYKDVIPFFLVLLAAVLLITYLPFLSTWLPVIIKV